MDREAFRDLQLLTEISSRDSVTQRRLAKQYRLALGLTNYLMRRLVKKGYVKIVNLERRRLRYLITPKGVAEKARLTYEYLECSLYLYRQLRALLHRSLSIIITSGRNATVLYGSGEVAEIALLLLQQQGIEVVAVVDEPANRGARLLHHPVRALADLGELTFDWIVVASLKEPTRHVQCLRACGVSAEKIITIADDGCVTETLTRVNPEATMREDDSVLATGAPEIQ